MIDSAKIVAVVPARSGSQGVPHKNIADVGGKPLLRWSVDFAVNHPLISDVFITTDSPEYEKIAIEGGAKSLGLRPSELSESGTKTADVMLYMVDELRKQGCDYEYLLVLQPTSPQRQQSDLGYMLELLYQQHNAAVVSVSLLEDPHPYKLKRIDDNGVIHSFIEGSSSELPRQQLPAAYRLTGAFYLIHIPTFLELQTLLPEGRTAAYVTDSIVNVDTPDDLAHLRHVMAS